MPTISSGNFLTDFMDFFKAQTLAGSVQIQQEAFALIIFLGVIEIALCALLEMEQDHLKLLTKKILSIGFISWLVTNWVSGMNFCGMIFDSFISLGIMAAGAGEAYNDPGSIGKKAVEIIGDVLTNVVSMGVTSGSIPVILLKIIVVLIIFISMVLIAVLLFKTAIEFYIISILTQILIPFHICRFTKFMAEKSFGAIISLGVKMMVIQFVLTLFIPLTAGFKLKPEQTVTDMLVIVVSCVGMLFVILQVPNYAQTLVTGSLSQGGPGFSDIGRNGVAGMVMAGNAASRGMNAMGNAARNAGKAAMFASARGSGGARGKTSPKPPPLPPKLIGSNFKNVDGEEGNKKSLIALLDKPRNNEVILLPPAKNHEK